MSETLRDILIAWNKGVYRGARRNLAKAIGVNEGTISNWFLGRGTPSEQAVTRMAHILRKAPDQISWFFPKINDPKLHYDGFKRRGLIEIEQSTGDFGESIQVNVSKELADKFMAVCKFERRDANSQMEIILEQWFAQRDKATADDNTIVHPSTGSVKPGVQPFATSRHRRIGEGRPSGRA